MYKRQYKLNGVERRDQLSLLQFRLPLVHILIASPSTAKRQIVVEQESLEEENGTSRPNYRKVVLQVLPQIRYDNTGHFLNL